MLLQRLHFAKHMRYKAYMLQVQHVIKPACYKAYMLQSLHVTKTTLNQAYMLQSLHVTKSACYKAYMLQSLHVTKPTCYKTCVFAVQAMKGESVTDTKFTDVEVFVVSPDQVSCQLATSKSYKISLTWNGNVMSVGSFRSHDTSHELSTKAESSFARLTFDSVCFKCDTDKQTCEEKGVC